MEQNLKKVPVNTEVIAPKSDLLLISENFKSSLLLESSDSGLTLR